MGTKGRGEILKAKSLELKWGGTPSYGNAHSEGRPNQAHAALIDRWERTHLACEPGLNPDPQSLRTRGAGVPEGMSQGCLYGLGIPLPRTKGCYCKIWPLPRRGGGWGVRGLLGQEVVWVRQGGTGRKAAGE